MTGKKFLLALVVLAMLAATCLAACDGSEPTSVSQDSTATVPPTPIAGGSKPTEVSRDPTPDAGVEVKARIQAASGGTVELDDGSRIVIPPRALKTDQQVTLTLLDSKPAGGEGTFSLPGQVIEVQAEQEVFDSPIQITLPYDEQLVPADRTEEEIFAVFLYEGQWHRVDGDVDRVANTITVDVLHASIWTWATDKLVNAVDAIKSYLGILETHQVPQTVEQAEALVAQRQREWEQAVQEANFSLDELEESMTFGAVKEVARTIVLQSTEILLAEFGVKVAEVKIAGIAVGYFHPILGAFYLLDVSEHSGEVLGKIYRVEKAHERLREAQAMLWALEHPTAQNMPPDYAEALGRAIAEIIAAESEKTIENEDDYCAPLRGPDILASETFADSFMCGNTYFQVDDEGQITAHLRWAVLDATVPFGSPPTAEDHHGHFRTRCFQADNLTTGELGYGRCHGDFGSSLSPGSKDTESRLTLVIPDSWRGDEIRLTFWIIEFYRQIQRGSTASVRIGPPREEILSLDGRIYHECKKQEAACSFSQDTPAAYVYRITMQLP